MPSTASPADAPPFDLEASRARHATGAPLDEAEEHHWPIPWVPVEGTREGFTAWLECMVLRASTSGVAALPSLLARPTMNGIARLFRLVDKRHRDAARRFLRQSMLHAEPDRRPCPDEVESRLMQCYRHLVETTARSPAWVRQLRAPDWRERVTCDISPEVEALRGKGAILVGPHVGNWEAGGGIMARLGFGPVYGIVKPPKNAPLSRYMQRVREGRGIRLLPRRGGIQYAASVVEGGGLLVLLLDQRAKDKAVIAPFFGKMALCDRSAAVLIRRLRVPLIFGAVYSQNCPRDRAPYQTLVHARTVMHPSEFHGMDPVQILTRINEELERLIQKRPDQYLWLHDRYRGAPEEPAAAGPA